MPSPPPHPLLPVLDLSGPGGPAATGVTRVERCELRGSSMWAGAYASFVLRRGMGTADCFLCTEHADVGWAVGTLVYQWLVRREMPADVPHLTDVLFAFDDVMLGQPLKCWFHAEMREGQCCARPIIPAFDATSPGRYFSVNDFVHRPPGARGDVELWVRLAAVLIPLHRCPGEGREYTLASDGGMVSYRKSTSGRLEVTRRDGGAAGAPGVQEIIDLANRRSAERGQR